MKTALKWIIGIVVVAALLVGGFFVLRGQQNNATAATTVQTAQVVRDTIQATVSSNGSVQPNADVQLSFGSSGTVAAVNVVAGQRVKKGDVLASIDNSDLKLSVQQAQASLDSANANLATVKAGATAQQLADAQASLASAEAKYNQTKTGGYSGSDIAAAKASLDSAKAKLAILRQGPTAANIASAKASLDSAKIKLQQAKSGNATAADIASATANLNSAKLKLQQTINGNATSAQIASAQASLDAAKAKLAQVQAGPSAATTSAAQLKVTNAQTSLNDTITSQQSTVDAALVARDQADNAVRNAQDNLHTVYAQTHDLAGNFRSDPANNPGYNEELYAQAQRSLDDATGNQQKAADTYNAALVTQKNQVAMAQANLSDAQKQLNETLHPSTAAADLASAQQGVTAAQTSLDSLTKGSTQTDVQIQQLAVDQAQTALNKLTAPSSATDIQAAQDAVTQAQSSYDSLVAPATADTIAADEAAVASAQSSYDKMVQGGTSDDLTQAQAAVTQAQDNLDTLKAEPTAANLDTAQASVEQAQTNLTSAQLKLTQADITAPFNGVVNAVSVAVGQQGSTNALELVDDSSYHIDLNVGEADIPKVALGQDVSLTFDAVPTATVTGKVTFIASKSTVQSNVVSYLTTITLDNASTAMIKPGMTANANIVYLSHQNALLVPSKAVRTVGNTKVVTVRSGGANKDVTVQVGLSDGTYTEVTSGDVGEGDTVVLNSTTTTTTTNRGGGGGFGGGGFRGIGG